MKELQRVDGAEYVTVEEAAQALGIKGQTIRNYLTKGSLEAYKFKTLTLVKVEELQRSIEYNTSAEKSVESILNNGIEYTPPTSTEKVEKLRALIKPIEERGKQETAPGADERRIYTQYDIDLGEFVFTGTQQEFIKKMGKTNGRLAWGKAKPALDK